MPTTHDQARAPAAAASTWDGDQPGQATGDRHGRRLRRAGIDRLTGQDVSSLWPEDLGWPQDIGAIAILDGEMVLDANGRLRLSEVQAAIARRIHLVPRLRQVMYRPRRTLGGPLWVDATDFDIADHVRIRPLGEDAGDKELLHACARLRRHPLDRSRPLWQLWLLPGMSDGRVGMLLRLHHVLADGVASTALIGALLELTPRPAAAEPVSWHPAPAPTTRDLAVDAWRRRASALGTVATRLAHPGRTARTIRTGWPAIREVLAGSRAPRTSLNRRPYAGERTIAVVPGRLDAAKRCAHANQATVNDLVLTVVAGGLRELLSARGERVDDLVLLAAVPVSLHREGSGQARGNLDGGMVIPLPVGEPDPTARLRLIAAESRQRKRIPRPQLFAGVLAIAAVQKAMTRMVKHQRRVNVYVANVPGPPALLYLAGAPLRQVFAVVPIMGNMGLGVGVLSYAGQLNFTTIADRDGFPDLDVFLVGMRRSLAELHAA
jgi:diacylglycerol O-acyltransferase / wax synthase